jgi:hypothetical protein
MMDPNLVRGLTNQLLYGIDRVPDLGDDATVERLADALINRRTFKQPVEGYFEALSEVLAAGRLPADSLGLTRRFTEPEILAFLDRLHRKLDAMRPWPRPRYLKLDVGSWPTFAQARGIARIDMPEHQVEGLLNSSFDGVEAGTAQLPVMILELRTGETVALMGSTDRTSTVWTLLQRDPGDPATLIDHVRELTGFSEDVLQPLA